MTQRFETVKLFVNTIRENRAEVYFLGLWMFDLCALFLFILCAAILMLVSKFTTAPVDKDLSLVTFQERDGTASRQWSTDAILTVVLIGLVLMLWLIFSPWGIA